MSPTLAIDFGSSRTKIAYFCPKERKPKIIELGQEIRSVMPSVFYIPPSGSVLVGDHAAQMADEDPAGIVVDIKREIHRPRKIRCGEGRVPYQRWELAAAMFSEIRSRCDKEVFHNGSIDSCTLTVPVCFSEPQRQKLQQAAHQAGFTSVKILDEPIAAAMHWLVGSGKDISDHVIVVDIGGGTTDLAALKRCGSTYEAIPDLPSSGFESGGCDIDKDIRRTMENDPGYNDDHAGALLMRLRQVKERLQMDRDDFTINLAGIKQTVSRAVVETAVRTLVEKTCAATSRFLKDFEEVTGRTDTPVLLAGGGSKLLGMKEAIEAVAGDGRVFVWNDSDFAIAMGATLAHHPAASAASAHAMGGGGMIIDCGHYRFDHGWVPEAANKAGWVLGSNSGAGGNYREQKIPILFKNEFLRMPQVLTMLSGLDVADSPVRLRVTAESVSTTGFVLTIGTWVNSEIYGISVQWMAIGNWQILTAKE